MFNYKNYINNTISDLVSCFLYYDRKEDDVLPVGKIEELIKSGEISSIDIINTFCNELNKGLKINGNN